MRAFIVLCCLATAYAASVGYDYERQGTSGFVGGDQGFGGAVGGVNQGFGGAVGGVNGGNNGGFGVGSNDGFSGGNNAGFGGGNNAGFGGGNNGGIGGGNNGGSGSFGAPAAEFTKEFYSYTAPEGAFDDNSGNEQFSSSLKRGLRVVFIKGPENSGLENAALQLAKSAAGQRTAIYVLNKQADIGDLANKLNNLNKNDNNKPEVHFVKYRTPADAENAQRTIQSQYDSLGGKSNNINGGVAPVLDFASKGSVGSPFQAAEPAGSYLPSNKRV